MALRPAQVHAQEHLGPVGRLGAAGPGADGQQRGALVIGPREEERGPLALVIGAQRIGFVVDTGRQLGVALGQLGELLEVVGASGQGLPRLELFAQPASLAQDALGLSLIVPEAGRAGGCVEGRQAVGLGPEVKAAPTSREPAPRARGRPRRPPSCARADPAGATAAAR
jgi:hypothetical protein